MYNRKTLSGTFPVIGKHLIAYFKRHNLWTPQVRDWLIITPGSVQNANFIPTTTTTTTTCGHVKNVFKTAWEISQKYLLHMARDRAPFIDQSQSMNLFGDSASVPYVWMETGLENLLYYLHTKPAAQFTIDPEERDPLVNLYSVPKHLHPVLLQQLPPLLYRRRRQQLLNMCRRIKEYSLICHILNPWKQMFPSLIRNVV